MRPPLLRIEGADVFYGASQILFGLDLAVEQGQTLALLGRNGAGKSTTFKAIAGIVPPRRGQITLDGAVISGRPPYRIARAGVGYVPEDRQVFPEHSVHDNLLIGAKRGPGTAGRTAAASTPAARGWTTGRVYEVFPVLASMKDRRAGRLSGGEQQMLTIARALMGNPGLLLLDEPSEGLAPIIVQAIAALIRTLRGTGVTILLAEQNMHFCLGIATHAAIIDRGQVVYRGGIGELRDDDAVVKRYLAV